MQSTSPKTLEMRFTFTIINILLAMKAVSWSCYQRVPSKARVRDLAVMQSRRVSPRWILGHAVKNGHQSSLLLGPSVSEVKSGPLQQAS
jgi:hypothetical protein